MSGSISRRDLLRAAAVLAAGSAVGWPSVAEAAGFAAAPGVPVDEDGYEMWLRYRPLGDRGLQAAHAGAFAEIVVTETDPVIATARDEVVRGLRGLLGRDVPVRKESTGAPGLVLGTPAGSATVRDHVDAGKLAAAGPEGYVLTEDKRGRDRLTFIASTDPRGVLHGAFAFLRLLQTRQAVKHLDVVDRPANPLRLANHWDNLNGSVERGYAGASIFWGPAAGAVGQRIVDYARLLASVGVNGAVLNNVNADPRVLTAEYLGRVEAIADILRRHGVTTYLSANFAAPLALGDLDTADPSDAQVRDWWRRKADEIYGHVPDFGGFLVKANSEGQPGPSDYGRTHADGANMLGRALGPHGGVVMWRAFVYDPSDGDVSTDAYNTFKPLDGSFDDNVIVQAKNGPVDFHVREPVHPLFGQMPKSNMMLEVQVTQEHTGHEIDLDYLIPWWSQILQHDTYGRGKGAPTWQVVAGRTYDARYGGMTGVMNIGMDRNWTGNHLMAANTFGYGRLAWDPEADPGELARDWVRMTFDAPDLEPALVKMLLTSWKTFEDYTSPLGSTNLVASLGAHYDPDPVAAQNAHRADAEGIGFDRTVATGTGFTGLYHEPWASVYENVATCPDELILFMHHVPWRHRLHSGTTVVQHIYSTHFEGLARVMAYRNAWREKRSRIDARRFAETLERFDQHVAHATLWRDVLVSFFFSRCRILDEGEGWLQVEPGAPRTVLLGGLPNRLFLTVGNATHLDRTVTATIQQSEGWKGSTTTASIPSNEFEELTVLATPPLAGEATQVDLSVAAGGLPVLGGSGYRVFVAPSPALTRLALDAGPAGSAVFPGYDALTPAMAWDPARGFGWVGAPPTSRDRGPGDQPLRRDFVNAGTVSTLRVAVPAGRHLLRLLVGDNAIGSSPTIVSIAGAEVARSPSLGTGEFSWLEVDVDGGGPVDLTFSGPAMPAQHWRVNAVVLVDPSAPLPRAAVLEIEPTALLMLPGRTTPLTVWLANPGDSDVTVTPEVTVTSGYEIQGDIPAVRIPAGGVTAVRLAAVRRGTAVGTLSVAVDGRGYDVALQPTDNWVRVATMTASSTHSPSSPANLNDGSTDSAVWGGGGAGGWNDDTAGEFPDSVTAAWDEAVTLSRVKVFTLNSSQYPAAAWGVRDFDLQVRSNESWTTVAQVRGNTAGVVERTFPALSGTALRVLVHASNSGDHSRLIELEAYAS